MRVRRRSIGGRDQRVTSFSTALMRLCDGVGAVGAALVDAEGETVDYAGAMDPFDIKVAAAEWAVVLVLLKSSRVPAWADTETLVIRGGRKSYFVRALVDGYAIVLQLLPHAFGISHRGVSEAVRELCLEAGLAVPTSFCLSKVQWWRLDVRCATRPSRRPEAFQVTWCSGPAEVGCPLTSWLS